MKLRAIIVLINLVLANFTIVVWAQAQSTSTEILSDQTMQPQDSDFISPKSQNVSNNTVMQAVNSQAQESPILTLQNLTSLKNDLQNEIAELSLRLQENLSDIEKQNLIDQSVKLDEDLKTTLRNIQEIAAGADIYSLRAKEQPSFDFQQELFSLLEPAIKELKDMTSDIREKSEQRDRIAYYSNKLPITEQAINNINDLLEKAEDPALRSTLQSMLEAWENQNTFLKSEIQSAEFKLNKLEEKELSLAESSQNYFKSFFQKRGLYLGQALLAVLIIILLSRLIQMVMQRFIRGYQTARRAFRMRLLDLSQRIITGLLIIVAPMVVFYLAEDWLLFSLGVLLLLGMALTLRHAIPRYWELAQLFLNIGTVREGERIEMNGLPWLVQKINFYTLLNNPTAGLTRRVKIDDLLDIRSRPTKQHEAWFPCKQGDWLTFDNDKLAKVIGISEELTEVVLRGGAHKTFTTPAFLDCAPICLSQNFRIKETIGISYSHQAQSVTTICGDLREYIKKRIDEEGHGDYLLNLSVEFQFANASSLDLAVIADYDGKIAQLHNRLRRSTQRWCVEACTLNDWEIPFMQVTLNKPNS